MRCCCCQGSPTQRRLRLHPRCPLLRLLHRPRRRHQHSSQHRLRRHCHLLNRLLQTRRLLSHHRLTHHPQNPRYLRHRRLRLWDTRSDTAEAALSPSW